MYIKKKEIITKKSCDCVPSLCVFSIFVPFSLVPPATSSVTTLSAAAAVPKKS